uniref:ATP-binding domain-containing protein n=1 Tax=uncultured Bacteroides sp. TaxID=162156 RepID=UPI0025A9FD43
LRRLRTDEYFNALQVKYAYAVTCHKAQGGQWSRVFVESGWRGADTGTYLRWLYTALTRTTGLLYLVNWPKEQRGEKKDEGDA